MVKKIFVMAGLIVVSLAAFASGNPFVLVGEKEGVDGDKLKKAVAYQDADKQLELQSSTISSSISYKYDALGRLVCVIDNISGNREFVYDDAGNRSKVSLSSCN